MNEWKLVFNVSIDTKKFSSKELCTMSMVYKNSTIIIIT